MPAGAVVLYSQGDVGRRPKEGIMSRRFNITGTSIPEKHYMADVSDKLEQITQLIHQDAFVRSFCAGVSGSLIPGEA